MSELISGKEAKLAWANGGNVQILCAFDQFCTITNNLELGIFDDPSNKFRLKPKTITINGIEVPSPFEPKDGDTYYFINSSNLKGYGYNKFSNDGDDDYLMFYGAWRSEEEIKQVVAALRSIFKGE